MVSKNTKIEIHYPVIIMGMYRSGTSILTRMLMECGLLVGWELDEIQEALFFRRRNKKFINICGGRWDNRLPVRLILGNPSLTKEVISSLKRDISSFRVFSFMGPKLYLRFRSLQGADFLWGWKEPNTHISLEELIGAFTDPRYINVVRHGLDMTLSRNQQQFLDWGFLLGLEKPQDRRELPPLVFKRPGACQPEDRLPGQKTG